MSALGWGLFAVGVILIGEGYVIMGQNQRLKSYAEQLLGVGAYLVAAVPGKSAPRTDGSNHTPRRWYRHLVPFQPTPLPEVDAADLARWADDGGSQPAPDPFPPTVPMAAAWDTPTARAGLGGRHRAPEDAKR